ncbi:hypothetical protein Glove_140g149 [Diversispora epigaea]|uniref:G-protein coupled receptors family 1 profile domain-containing protein n=1 Tax=Diversispora epigaea TaxID=1348612 RepID=A0A397IV46_9GLOM|nr:hypothetical protein Glove_140g149 [Diversispora epigaea]
MLFRILYVFYLLACAGSEITKLIALNGIKANKDYAITGGLQLRSIVFGVAYLLIINITIWWFACAGSEITKLIALNGIKANKDYAITGGLQLRSIVFGVATFHARKVNCENNNFSKTVYILIKYEPERQRIKFCCYFYTILCLWCTVYGALAFYILLNNPEISKVPLFCVSHEFPSDIKFACEARLVDYLLAWNYFLVFFLMCCGTKHDVSDVDVHENRDLDVEKAQRDENSANKTLKKIKKKIKKNIQTIPIVFFFICTWISGVWDKIRNKFNKNGNLCDS